MIYEIEFTHIEKRTLTTEIEASSREEAIQKFNEDAYGAGTDPNEINCEGISIEIKYCKEM